MVLHEVIFEVDTPAGKGFDIILIISIPRSIYWAIVTLTTVGYGDLSPQTGLGQVLASMIMIFGHGIIAVPTGIVTVGNCPNHLQAGGPPRRAPSAAPKDATARHPIASFVAHPCILRITKRSKIPRSLLRGSSISPYALRNQT
ncbi:MAG: potassium channel family protein [Desulfosarcina sp.]|jgi:hypothetical protein